MFLLTSEYFEINKFLSGRKECVHTNGQINEIRIAEVIQSHDICIQSPGTRKPEINLWIDNGRTFLGRLQFVIIETLFDAQNGMKGPTIVLDWRTRPLAEEQTHVVQCLRGVHVAGAEALPRRTQQLRFCQRLEINS